MGLNERRVFGDKASGGSSMVDKTFSPAGIKEVALEKAKFNINMMLFFIGKS